MDGLQAEVGRWAERVFVGSDARRKALHIRKEAQELVDAAEGRGSLAEESADIVLILLHLAEREGFSLLAAAREKFAAVQTRAWGEPDAEGVVEHVRDGGS